jgi:23S rRNA pseudouridine1911/1915/1917 synthase
MPGAPERVFEFTVDPAAVGERLDRFLTAALPERSRASLARLIRKGLVDVDGKAGKAGQKLKAGQSLRIRLPEPEPVDLVPEAIPLDIQYEDEHLAVVDKPAGLVVHPAAGNRRGTLVHALLHHLDGLSGIGDKLRPGIVHRLDKDTSGLMVVAKSDAAHRRLVEMLAAKEVERRYEAIVWGELADPEGEIDLPIARDQVHRKRMCVVAEGGKSAQTRYSRIDTLDGFDYILLQLLTGRTHQIRVHLSHMGHPLLGDPLYGGRRGRLAGRSRPEIARCRWILSGLGRQALHSRRLRFSHPVTGEQMEFESALPPDIELALRRIRHRTQAEGESE